MSKGGSTTSAVTIPEYIEAAAQRNLNKAERISQIGYTPYYGPDVAAFTPMQQAGFQNTADLAGAYGMATPSSQQDIGGGMPTPTTYAGGVQGYSSAPIFEESLQTLGERRPGQKAYIDSFFIDPYSGGGAAGNFAPIDYTGYQTGAAAARAGGGGGGGASGGFDMGGIGNMGGAVQPASTGSDGTFDSWVSDQETYGAPGGHWGGSAEYETNLINNPNISDDEFWNTFESGEASGNLLSGGGSDGKGNFGLIGDIGNDIAGGIGDAAKGYFGGQDGKGYLGTIGDIGGAIGDALGYTNYNDVNATPSAAPTAQPYSAEANAAAIAAAQAAALTQQNPPGASTSGTENNAQNALNNTASAVRSLGLQSKIANNQTLTPTEQAIYNKAIGSGLGWMF
tara:strand:- start:4731 stop:5918 length:1188 start_codon:yes stop_codon:yes gene_type:complete